MLYHRLRQLDQRGTPIQIGLIAAGTFGTQIASQLAHAPGMRLGRHCRIGPNQSPACIRPGPDPRRPDRHSRRPCGY